MKILHITTNDSGGAGIACIRLHQALLAQNVESDVLTLYKNGSHERVHQFRDLKKRFFYKIQNSLAYRVYTIRKNLYLQGRGRNFEIISFPFSPFKIHEHELVQNADIIHLHWISNFLDYSSFFGLINKRIIWTFHDMNPFMGIFHYKEDLIKNQKEYGALNEKMQELKLEAIKSHRGRLQAIALSNWIYNESNRSVIGQLFEYTHIPNGINTEKFKPVSKDRARSALNIPLDSRVILFVADDLQNARKGYRYMAELMSQINDPDVIFVAVGKGALSTSGRLVSLGSVKDFSTLVNAFSASDIFIIPSLEDNQPNTIMEAMAFGLPIIGFNCGGIPELVKNGKTGYVVEKGDVQNLLQNVQFLLKNEDARKKISTNCRKEAEYTYSHEIQVKKHIKLYNSTLST